MPASSRRGCSRTPCACCRWHASWYATRSLSGCRSACGSSSHSTSEMSLHFAENAAARAAQAGSSRSRWPYSFMVDPQPAELMTMVSTLAFSKAAIILAGQRGRLIFEARVEHQRAAAWLVCGE